MRNRTLLLTVVIFFSACDNNPGNVRAGGRSAVDSTARDVYAGKARDTVVRIKSERPADSLEEDPEENPDTVLHRTIAEYRRPYLIDSTFNIGGSTFQLHLKHYCLMDSAIKLPKRYIDTYKLDSFVTHNFATRLQLDRDGKTVLQRTVYKKDFEGLLFPQLDTFAALSYPSVRLFADTILLHYSISIPLTDVGVGVTMAIDDHGVVSFNNRSY